MSYQMRYPQAPWGEAWMNAQPTEVDGSAGPRVPIPRQVAVPQSRSPRSMGAALMAPGVPQDNPNGFKSRLGSAIQGLGSQLDPNGGGIESFLAGATGGYTNTQQSLTATAQAPYLQAQAAQEQALKDRETQSRIDYYRAQATRELRPANEVNAPRIGAADWVTDPKDPTRQLRGYTDPRSGIFVPQTLDGEVLVRPTPTATDHPRNIDPLSPQGITASGVRAGVVARAGAGAPSAAQQTSAATYDALLAGIDNVDTLLTQRPQGVGLTFAAPEILTQRIDPDGVPLRAAIADVRTVLLLARSGGAVSDGEASRIEPLLPKPSDTPEAIQRKLPELRKAIQRLRDALARQRGPQAAPDNNNTDYVPPPE